MDIIIEKDIPIPSTPTFGRGRTLKYPLGGMKVGDSIVTARYINSSMNNFIKNGHPEWEFRQQRISKTEVRVWRKK